MKRFVHNVIAHPLLVLWPRVGEWLHELTEPDEWGAGWEDLGFTVDHGSERPEFLEAVDFPNVIGALTHPEGAERG